jgi:cation/acetate symporter
VSIGFFFLFVAATLVITYFAARKSKSASQFYAAGRSVTGLQNGLALSGDYMSAASFLGIAGLVALKGYDGLIYSIGFLVGWPIIMFLIAEPLRNLGKYTFADVVAYRLSQNHPGGGLMRIAVDRAFYLIAQMVGSGSLVQLMFGLPYEAAGGGGGRDHDRLCAVRGNAGHHLGADHQGRAAAGRGIGHRIHGAGEIRLRPSNLFAFAAEKYGDKVLAPGGLVANPWDALSLGIALMFGTAACRTS